MSGRAPPSSNGSPIRSDSEDQEGLMERKILGSVLPRLTSTVISLARRGDEDDAAESDSGLGEIVQVLQSMPPGENYSAVVELASGLCELEQRWKEDRKALAKARELPETRDTSEDESSDPGARVRAVSVVRLQSEMLMLKNETKELRARNESLEESLSESLEIIVQIRCIPPVPEMGDSRQPALSGDPLRLGRTRQERHIDAFGTHAFGTHMRARQLSAW